MMQKCVRMQRSLAAHSGFKIQFVSRRTYVAVEPMSRKLDLVIGCTSSLGLFTRLYEFNYV
ncbi:hypothetical protein M6B38_393515 [Iris pallida]|uniref:Uncharacterized protein n=1 Tax=Iris pallida TaxID=29817 RepID=A0AAX6FY47_IRIPA|nr:hypothetical protein M6B38_393515 [Iris pallida]